MPPLKFGAQAPACDLSCRTIRAYYFYVDLAIFAALFMEISAFSELTMGIIGKNISMRMIVIADKKLERKISDEICRDRKYLCAPPIASIE